MKINEVEKRTGISAHNIRFYEKENLIKPVRNPLNAYREYAEADIVLLNRIKFLRMLDISVKDIRECLEGNKKLSDTLNYHLESLTEEKNRIKQNQLICQQFTDMEINMDDLSETMVEQIFADKESYIYSLEKVKKQDRIRNLVFVSKQLLCIIGCAIALIILLQFYITICLTYMNRPFQIITILLAIFLFGCISRIVYYNEKNK